MGSGKRYSGYKSYSWLETGRNYRVFKLAKEVGRVLSRIVELSKAEEEIVEKIMSKNMGISLHDHTFILTETPRNLEI